MLAALAWLLLEGFVRVVLGNWLYTLLYPVGAPLHSKGQQQASKDVTTAAVNLVSIVHVAIAVSFCRHTQPPTSTSSCCSVPLPGPLPPQEGNEASSACSQPMHTCAPALQQGGLQTLHSSPARPDCADTLTHWLLLIPVQVPIAVQVLLDPEVYSDTIYGHTQLSVLMCVISSGYFLHDLVVVLLRINTEGVAMLVHACCCLFVYKYAVYSFYLTFYGERCCCPGRQPPAASTTLSRWSPGLANRCHFSGLLLCCRAGLAAATAVWHSRHIQLQA